MANAKKEKSGNWRVQIYIGKDENGVKHKKSFTAPTKWEAEKMAEEYKQGKRDCEMTVGECIDDYIEMKENVLAPSTIYGYKIIRKNRLQTLMNVPAKDIDNKAVQRAVSSDARKYSHKSLTEAVSLVKSSLKMQGITPQLNITFPPKKSVMKVLPNVSDVLNAIMDTDIELPCLLALCLGLRCSEVRGLKREDLIGDTLYIHRRKVFVGRKDVTQEINKNETSNRKIHCPQFLIDRINKVETDYVCDITYPLLGAKFRAIMKKNNLKMTFHDLRHLNASIMLVLGVPDKYAMARGGWASTSVMKSVYQNVITDEKKKVDAVVDDYFEQAVSRISSRDSKEKA